MLAETRSQPLPEQRRGQTRCGRVAGPEGWRAMVCRAGLCRGSALRRRTTLHWYLAPRWKRRESFLSPTRGGFLFAFTHPIAVAFNGGDISVMEQAIQ